MAHHEKRSGEAPGAGSKTATAKKNAKKRAGLESSGSNLSQVSYNMLTEVPLI